jgi:hypothetical protein
MRCAIRRCERNHMPAAGRACWPSAAPMAPVRAKSACFFTWRSRADQVSLECERFEPHWGSIGSNVPRFASTRLGLSPCSQENRCLERLTLANAMSIMNRMLRNSEGTSIIVWRLDRAKAEHKECYRRDSATSAVNSENIQGLSLHALQPSGLKF